MTYYLFLFDNGDKRYRKHFDTTESRNARREFIQNYAEEDWIDQNKKAIAPISVMAFATDNGGFEFEIHEVVAFRDIRPDLPSEHKVIPFPKSE